MNNILIVYYSLEGNTKFLAENLSSKIGSDILRLDPKKKIDATKFTKYFWGGMQSLFSKEPELENYEVDLDKYDTIIFGTPVWASTFAPPIRTFINSEDLSGKKVALFCSHEGGEGTILRKFEKALSDSEFIGGIDLKSVLENKEYSLEKLYQWAKKVELL